LVTITTHSPREHQWLFTEAKDLNNQVKSG